MTRVDQAYDGIKAKILNNTYAPGHQALEQEIARELAVSRTPVREALIRLQNEGLVRLVPRRGMHVLPLAPDDMREIYEVLTAVESMAVEILAQLPKEERRLSEIEAALDEMDKALENADLSAWADADDSFHRALVIACGNQRLAEIALRVRDQGHRARLLTLRLRPTPVRSNDEHRDVLKCIRIGDWKSARDKHYEHRKKSAAVLLKILEEYSLSNL